MNRLTPEQKSAIADRILGTSGVDDLRIAEEYDIEMDDLETIASEHNVERCKVCNWWFEVGELNDEYECDDCAS